MNSSELVQLLSWDSEFFGVRIARYLPEELTSESLAALMDWQQAQKVDCLYFLADPNQAESLRLAESNNFHLTDLRITLESGGDIAQAMPTSVRPFREGDRAALRAIARVSHRDSRFYFDGHFPQERCDALYETWIDKSLDGYADATLVAEVEGNPAGYITCHRDAGEGKIGLVGVHADYQGRSLGQALVKASLAWFAGDGLKKVTVVTQGRNTRAQRLYQHCGFLTRSVQLWYHWWNEQNNKEPHL
jgi:dTDP-4-amino-4,6-dideoxy-D-galactose acyltransferase